MRSAAVVGIAVALAFTIRVAPSWQSVFTPAGVNFQDNDSWFHMRAVQNLSAHFPSQSGFDPYELFPGGQRLLADPWDLAVASVAWVLGFGKPAATLVDQVGAWLPAVLGAMLPIPVFFLSRRLFGDLAGQLSALAVAVIPGTLLWETHLGVPDHHVAECLLSFAALTLLCVSAEQIGHARIRLAALAGLMLGMYLCVRPAGVFVPAAIAIAVLLEPALAQLAACALAVAGMIFLTSSGSPWSQYTWLSLGGAFLACAFSWVLGALWQRKNWRRSLFPLAVTIAAVAAVGLIALVRPATFLAFGALIRSYMPGGHASTVNELSPLWKLEGGVTGIMLDVVGGLWLLGFPVLAYYAVAAWRIRRPALTLFIVWALVMTAASILQVRMVLYFAPVIAVAAGVGARWLIGKAAPRFRAPALAVFVTFILATSLPSAIRQIHVNGGPDSDWRAALHWLATNTPEPMGDPAAWSRFWPARRKGEEFTYPKSAYGILTWWDYGDWIFAISHRIPLTNSTQEHAADVAAALTDTLPESAHQRLLRMSARYAVLNPWVLTSDWPAIVLWADGDNSRYRKTIYAAGPGGRGIPVRIYLPDYYRSLAVRLYMFDGRSTGVIPEVSVFTTRREKTAQGEFEFLVAERKFPSAQKASDYMMVNSGEDMTLGSTDPTKSCVELPDLPWVRRVFTSDETPLRIDRPPRAVKVFEVKP